MKKGKRVIGKATNNPDHSGPKKSENSVIPMTVEVEMIVRDISWVRFIGTGFNILLSKARLNTWFAIKIERIAIVKPLKILKFRFLNISAVRK